MFYFLISLSCVFKWLMITFLSVLKLAVAMTTQGSNEECSGPLPLGVSVIDASIRYPFHLYQGRDAKMMFYS